MFKSIINKFKKKERLVDSSTPFTMKRLVDPNTSFSIEEFEAIEIARGQTLIQISLAQGPPEKMGKINNPEHIKPWVLGYFSGILDCAVQHKTGQKSSSIDLLLSFFECNMVEELYAEAFTCYSASMSLQGSPESPFYAMYEDFISGALVGYDFLPNAQAGKIKYALFWKLTNK